MAGRTVKIDGKEIEVPDGFSVVIQGDGSVKVVKSTTENDKSQKVIISGKDIPESVSYELRSIGVKFDENKLKENIASVARSDYYFGVILEILIPSVILGTFLKLSLSSDDPFVGGSAVLFLVLFIPCVYSIWRGWKRLSALSFDDEYEEKEEKKENKNTPSEQVKHI